MNNSNVFSKQPLIVEQQLELLIRRRLIVEDKEVAMQVLSTVGYYRLSAYFKPFDQSDKHEFIVNKISFNMIRQLYEFDRAIRLLVIDAIERIEVAFRAFFLSHMSVHYGATWYILDDCFNSKWQQVRAMPCSSKAFFLRNLID